MPYPSQIDPETIGERALAVVEKTSWAFWSLREIARALGVSPNALYRYVDDRDGLTLAIGEAAAYQMLETMQQVEGEGEAAVVDAAMRYVNFAMQRPGAFDAFVHAKPPPGHPRSAVWGALWANLHRHVVSVVPNAADAAAFAFWALVHGRAELARGPARLAGPTDGLADAVRALLTGFLHLGTVPSPLPPVVTS